MVHRADGSGKGLRSMRRWAVCAALAGVLLNGYELAARLRNEGGTRRMLLVAVTGWGQAADRERARAAGFDQHLVKPVAIERALELLSTLAPA